MDATAEVRETQYICDFGKGRVISVVNGGLMLRFKRGDLNTHGKVRFANRDGSIPETVDAVVHYGEHKTFKRVALNG